MMMRMRRRVRISAQEGERGDCHVEKGSCVTSHSKCLALSLLFQRCLRFPSKCRIFCINSTGFCEQKLTSGESAEKLQMRKEEADIRITRLQLHTQESPKEEKLHNKKRAATLINLASFILIFSKNKISKR